MQRYFSHTCYGTDLQADWRRSLTYKTESIIKDNSPLNWLTSRTMAIQGRTDKCFSEIQTHYVFLRLNFTYLHDLTGPVVCYVLYVIVLRWSNSVSGFVFEFIGVYVICYDISVIDVQADWRRSLTYGRAPNAIDISQGSLTCPSYTDTGPPFLNGDSDIPPHLVAFYVYDTLGIRRTHSRLNTPPPGVLTGELRQWNLCWKYYLKECHVRLHLRSLYPIGKQTWSSMCLASDPRWGKGFSWPIYVGHFSLVFTCTLSKLCYCCCRKRATIVTWSHKYNDCYYFKRAVRLHRKICHWVFNRLIS